MGCSSSNVDIEDFDSIEKLLTEKKNILGEATEKNEVNEAQKVKMVRIDIDISEKLEDINAKIKENGGTDVKNKYDNIMKEYQSLVSQWKQFLKEDIEEEEIIQGKIAKDWGNYNNDYQNEDEIPYNNNNIETNIKNENTFKKNNNNNNNNNFNNKQDYPFINDEEDY